MPSHPLTYVERLENRIQTPGIPSVTAGVLGLALTLWIALFAGWVPMPMPGDVPMSAPGAMEMAATAGGLGAVLAYLVAWGTMMSAMMYPAMVPFVRRYVRSLDATRTEVAAAVGTFLATYSLVWTSTGIVPVAVDALFGINDVATTVPSLVYGGLLVFVGVYQLSAFKHVPLRTCCGTVDVTDPDPVTAARLGLHHGRSCVLATWPLFALLVFAGSMNFFWMVALTAIVAAERLPHWGPELANAVGTLAAVAGVLVLLPIPFPFP